MIFISSFNREISVAASCWAFTSILGCSLGGALSDLLGRRVVIMVTKL